MFNWIKRLLGLSEHNVTETSTVIVDAPEPAVTKQPTKPAVEQAKPIAKTESKQKPLQPKKETKATLGKLTKTQIDALAVEKLGVNLDRRKTKDVMIDEFLKAQKAK